MSTASLVECLTSAANDLPVMANPVRRSTEAPKEDSARRAKITDEHRAEATKLREIFVEAQAAAKKAGNPFTQQQFAEDYGFGSQSLLWQYLYARIPLNLKTAFAFARGLNCRVVDFSPRLAAMGPDHQAASPPMSVQYVSAPEVSFLAMYRALKQPHRAQVLALTRKLYLLDNPQFGGSGGGGILPDTADPEEDE